MTAAQGTVSVTTFNMAKPVVPRWFKKYNSRKWPTSVAPHFDKSNAGSGDSFAWRIKI